MLRHSKLSKYSRDRLILSVILLYQLSTSHMKPASQSPPPELESKSALRPKISINPMQQQVDDRWMQFKVIGKNIQPRSYHISVVYGSYLYVQGGYDVDRGFLSDFYRLQLEHDTDGFKWEQLSQNLKGYPGRLKGHTAVPYQTTMVIFGGQVAGGQGSNSTFIFDFIKSKWEAIEPGPEIPRLDSHAAFIIDDTMYVYGGFKDEEAAYSSKIYALDLIKKTWSTFYTPEKNSVHPQGRGNLGLVVFKGDVWMFGGTNGTKTLNDLWKFQMATKTWTEIKAENPPEPRRSHSMIVYDDYIYIFAGIQDVTKQKNDMIIFSPSQKKWVKILNSSNLVYECSPTIKRNRSAADKKKSVSPTRKVADVNRISLLNVNHQKTAGSDKNQIMKRIMQQNKHKKFLEKKHELLKQFNESPLAVNQTKRKLSPTSENMLKTLQLIGDQQHSKRVMHQEVVYDPSKKYILGKKPCARDAHTAVVYNDRMLIFGGDRHLMSFSDIYYFDLKKGLDSKKLYEMRNISTHK